MPMSWQKSQSVLRMEARVAADPHDTDAWSALLAEAVSHQPDDFRPLFDACLTAVPMLATAWRQWIFAEMHAGQPAAVAGNPEGARCPEAAGRWCTASAGEAPPARRAAEEAAEELEVAAVEVRPPPPARWRPSRPGTPNCDAALLELPVCGQQ